MDHFKWLFPARESLYVRPCGQALAGIALGFLLAMPVVVQADEYDDLVSSLKHGATNDERVSAAEQLGILRDPRALQPLGEVVRKKGEDLSLRYTAALALGKFNDPSAFLDLCKGVSEPDYMVSEASIVSLGLIGEPSAIPILLDVLTHPAGTPLAHRLNCVPGEGEPQNDQSNGAGQAGKLDFTTIERIHAASSLGLLKAADAIDELGAVLHEPDWRLVAVAVGALSLIADPAAVPYICEIEDHPEGSVRAAVTASLAVFSADCDGGGMSVMAFSLLMSETGSAPGGTIPLPIPDPNVANFGLFKTPNLLDYYYKKAGLNP